MAYEQNAPSGDPLMCNFASILSKPYKDSSVAPTDDLMDY